MNLIAIVNILSEVVGVIQDMFSSHIIASLRSAMKASVNSNNEVMISGRRDSVEADEDELARALGEALQVEFEVSDRVLSELNTLDIASVNIETMESELRKRADSMIRKKSDRERYDVLLTELKETASKLETYVVFEFKYHSPYHSLVSNTRTPKTDTRKTRLLCCAIERFETRSFECSTKQGVAEN